MKNRIARTFIPTILCKGAQLFEQTIMQTKLKLKSTQRYNGVMDMVYLEWELYGNE